MQYNQNTKIAVVGVSANPDKYGHKVFRDLLRSEYNIVGINPKGGVILNQKIYPSLLDLPEIPELVILVVPPEVGMSVLESALDLGVTNVWLQPGAESDELIKFAQDNNLDITHHACFMTTQGIW
ncbi:MAG: CoA-binding protein [Patescibacteria group bacterium]|nr:MAG: CoA-binding protein [Patescibacteria group bacterium]